VHASVLDQPINVEVGDEGKRVLRGRKVTTWALTIVVCAIVGFAVVEALFHVPGYGITSATSTASRSGDRVEVRFARVTRGQLATPLDVRIERDGGFDGPVTVTISSNYLDLFITNDLSPQPSSETSTADANVMTFEPPPSGNVLDIRWDIVAKPSGWFSSRTGTVSVLSGDGTPTVTASFHTSVRP
jgi:hypothetical protein